jgi:2-iminobutanoate/2-iminopropanoate deaminase
MRYVTASKAAGPFGHYSQAVVHGGLVYVSGQLPAELGGNEKRLGPIEEQTERAMRNLRETLLAAGSDLCHVLKTTVYISDISLWDRVNSVYAAFFAEHRPARAIVPTNPLHHGFQIEIEAIASLNEAGHRLPGAQLPEAAVCPEGGANAGSI